MSWSDLCEVVEERKVLFVLKVDGLNCVWFVSGGTQPVRSASSASLPHITEEHKVNLLLLPILRWNESLKLFFPISEAVLSVSFLLKTLVSHHSGVWLKQCDLFSACKVCSPCFCDFVGSLFHTLHQCVCLGSGWRTPWKKMTRPVFYSSWLAPKRISVWVTIMKNPWIETEIEVQVIHNSFRIYFSRIIFLANP